MFLQRLLFITFDPCVAEVSGVRIHWIESVLLIFLAIIIVVSVKMVGIILVSALVALPASFGLLLSKKYKTVLLISILFSVIMMKVFVKEEIEIKPKEKIKELKEKSKPFLQRQSR